MVNNVDGSNEIGEIAVSSSSDDNGISQLSIGCDTNIDINIEDTSKSYVRRRKCNEKVQICEKAKKRETLRKVKKHTIFLGKIKVFLSRKYKFFCIL